MLLDWQHISSRIQQIPKGRKPLWFLTLENNLLIFQQTREINSQYLQLSNINTLSFTTGHYKIKPKPWLITYNETDIIIGKARRYNQTEDSILLHIGQSTSILHKQHYTSTQTIAAYNVQDAH